MSAFPGMPEATAAASRTVAGERRTQRADRLGERQPADAGFDAALRAHDRPASEKSEDAGAVAVSETDGTVRPPTVTEAQAPSPDDATAMNMEAQAAPLIMPAADHPRIHLGQTLRVENIVEGKGKRGPRDTALPAPADASPHEGLTDLPEGDLMARRPSADAPMDTRMSFRIQVKGWHQSRHFAAPAAAQAPAAEATPQSAAVDAARHRAAADMPFTLPQAPMSSAMADAPLPAGDTEALAGRILNLARELSPPAVTTRQLDIAIAPPQGGTLAVRLALRGDELQVTLRVPDAAMADRLKQEADHLARRLGQVEVHGATRVQVNVIVDPNAVTPAARSEAAHGFMQSPAHQQPMPQGQQGQPPGHMAGQGMGGHPGGGPGQGGAMHQGASHRHAPLMDEGANGNGSEARHDPVAERQAPAGHRRLYI